MTRRLVQVSLAVVALGAVALVAAQDAPPPPEVTVVREGHAQVSGAPRPRDVERAFDQQVDAMRRCAANSLGAIDGEMELRLVVHFDGTVTNAVVAARPTGATGAFVLCVTGVARRMRLPGFRASDAAVVIHARVHAPAPAPAHPPVSPPHS